MLTYVFAVSIEKTATEWQQELSHEIIQNQAIPRPEATAPQIRRQRHDG
jgi:hypothetical protein